MAEPTTAVLDAVSRVSSADWLRFLGRQRWFAAKGAEPREARVASVVPMPWGNGTFAIARLTVDTESGARTYQVPVALRDGAALPEQAVIHTSGDASLIDAAQDAEFRSGLVSALAHGATADAGGVRWVAEPVANPGEIDASSTRVGSAEQSNTSIVVGDSAILKLFRTLQPGVQPDVEVTGFLTSKAGFANTPRLLASMRFEHDGETTVAGMMQSFLAGSSDAWSYALDRNKSYFSASGRSEPANTFVEDARRLGAITRAMHEALACDDDDLDFAPEPVDGEDLDRWAHRTQQSIRDSLALLERRIGAADFPKERLPEAQALVRRRDHYLGWVNEIADRLGDDLGMRTRTHGDYHLGQVLRTRDGDFMIIDFEGEPARPIDERREKTSPLRDVAGMLRSFAYAAATLAISVEKTVDAPTRELRAARWERDVRAAYLDGYLWGADEDDATVLPEEEEHIRQLISLFETEKAFYELAYELNNRPAWAWIPMRGISKLFTKA